MQAKAILLDAQGRTTSHTLNLVDTITTIVDAETAIAAWRTDFEAASGLAVIKVSITHNMDITPNAADTGSNVDEGFKVTCLMEDGDNYTLEFPAPAKTAGAFDFITNGAVNVSDTQVSDLLANYQTAGSFRVGKYGQRVVDTVLNGYLSGR